MLLGTVLQRVILHEFCHVLGMVHEHQVPDSGLKWNKEYVYKNLSVHGISKESIDKNYFTIYDRSSINGSIYDPLRIMHYIIPEEFLLNGNPVKENNVLSELDKLWLSNTYPHDGETSIDDEPRTTEPQELPSLSAVLTFILIFIITWNIKLTK